MADLSVARARRPSLPAWAALCFFASGAAGLLYEAVWSKQLAYLLGGSLQAVATVVAAFLCGLALGARFLGVPLARRGEHIRMYALLELGVAALGILLLPALRGVDPVVGWLYRGLEGEGPAFALVRFVLLFVLLVPPAALMGATLPVLVAQFERDRIGPALARLYALNTFGAVAGSILAGFVLMPALGLLATTAIAAALNVSVAALAWTVARRERRQARPLPSPAPAATIAAPALDERTRTVFTWLFGLSGLAALAFQIAWVRLFSLMLGSSVYSFSAVLGAYLLGIAIGSAVASRLPPRAFSLVGFGRLQLALAAVAALEIHAFTRLPEWVYGVAQAAGASWGSLFAREVGLVLVFLLVPCALLGAAFPIATRLLQRDDGAHAAGFAYAVNTGGTIAGSLLAGFYAVPTWGVQGTHTAALLLSLAVGAAALVLAGAGRTWRQMPLRSAAAGLVVTVALLVLAPKWDPALMSAGAFRPVQAMRIGQFAQLSGGDGPTVWTASRRENVLFYKEGINGSVIVGGNKAGRWLRVGGKIDASTGDMETQVLVGIVPTIMADKGARTLVVGLGSGFTAAAVLAAGSGPTEIVELEPSIVEGSRFFHGVGDHPLADPRSTLILGDARTHLAHGSGLYGLIVSEPSNPWLAGVNNLFTVDFYRRVKTRLEPGGVFCQWIQLYELSPETFATLVNSFMQVFPEGHLFAVWRSHDVMLVAAPAGRALAIDRLANPEAQRLMKIARLASPESLAGYYGAPISAMRSFAQGAPLNTDDRPLVEYRAPRDLVVVGNSSPVAHPEVRALVPLAEAMPEGALFSAWSKERWFEVRIRLLAEQGDEPRAVAALRGAKTAGMGALAARLTEELGRTRLPDPAGTR